MRALLMPSLTVIDRYRPLSTVISIRKNKAYLLLFIQFIFFPLLCQSLDKKCKFYLKIAG